jgi:hypothetical protein
MPTAMLLYTSMAIMLNSEVFDSPDIGMNSSLQTIKV